MPLFRLRRPRLRCCRDTRPSSRVRASCRRTMPQAALVDANGWALPEAVFDAETRPGRARFPAAARTARRRHRRPGHLRALRESSYRLGARTLIYQPRRRCTATTSRRCSAAAGPGFLHRPGRRLLRRRHPRRPAYLSSAKSVSPRTASAARPHCGRSNCSVPASPAVRPTRSAKRSSPPLADRSCPANGSSSIRALAVTTPMPTLRIRHRGRDPVGSRDRRLEGRMAATGMETFLSRPRDANPTDAERAGTANAFDADLMISLRCAHYPNSRGERRRQLPLRKLHGSLVDDRPLLAGFIQREIVARTYLAGLPFARPHLGSPAPQPDADGPARHRLLTNRLRCDRTDRSALSATPSPRLS